MLTTRCWVALPMALGKRFSCRGLGVAGSGFKRGARPRRLRPCGCEASGEQAEDRLIGTGCRKADADARGPFDDAGGDLDQAQAHSGELGAGPGRGGGRGGAQGVQQPVGRGVEDEPELVGAGAAARGPVRGKLGLDAA